MRGMLPAVMPLLRQVTDEGGEAIVPEGGIEAAAWIQAGAIVVASILATVAVRRIVIKIVQTRDTSPHVARVVGRLISAVVFLAGVVYALNSLGVRIGPLLGALGVGGIALAFALQHVLENSVASLLIQARRPFVVGDQITASAETGTVEDVNLRAVVLRSLGGNRVFLPTSEILRTPLVNHTAYDRRRTSFTVGVAYSTDLDQAREVLRRAAASAEGVLTTPPVEVWAHQFSESSIDFEVRFWHPPRIIDEWRVRDSVARTVKRELDAAGITIPFPQRTLWFPEPVRGDGPVSPGSVPGDEPVARDE